VIHISLVADVSYYFFMHNFVFLALADVKDSRRFVVVTHVKKR